MLAIVNCILSFEDGQAIKKSVVSVRHLFADVFTDVIDSRRGLIHNAADCGMNRLES